MRCLPVTARLRRPSRFAWPCRTTIDANPATGGARRTRTGSSRYAAAARTTWAAEWLAGGHAVHSSVSAVAGYILAALPPAGRQGTASVDAASINLVVSVANLVIGVAILVLVVADVVMRVLA